MKGINSNDWESVTPAPVAVTTESGPESGRTYPGVEVPKVGHAHTTRGFSRKVLAATGVAVMGVAALVGPEAIGSWQDRDREGLEQAKADIQNKPHPAALQNARALASIKMYGNKGKAVDTQTADEEVKSLSERRYLNDVDSYVDPKHVVVSEDGKYFTVDGDRWRLMRGYTENGDILISASRTLVKSRLFSEDTEHAINPIVVGGAKNDLSSDLDGNGFVTDEELRTKAYADAKGNLHVSLQPEMVADNDY